ncbi:MAG TPA: heavy metal translocating P-type ATPase [Longimicrobiales bacterium]
MSGMDCSSCAATVEKALRQVEGVEDVRVDVVSGRVDVSYAPGAVAARDLEGAIARAGYSVEPDRSATARTADWWERHRRTALATASGILWALSLVVGRALELSGPGNLLAVGAMIAGGWTIVPRGVRAALNGALDMNFLMSLAALGALVIGEYEEAASALFLFAVAQLLEARSMERARNAIRALMSLSPAEATILRDGREVRLPADRVGIGDIVVVRPGEKIAVDGTVHAGHSTVDQAPITGESVPVEKSPGDDVFAGTLNGAGSLELLTTREYADTTLARIIHAVEEAQASRAPSQTFVDRFARIYTPAVVAAACAVFVLPPLLGIGAWSEWFYRALVLLVVACPCALVISTPVTVVSALTGSARRGILIKGGLHLENAGRASVVAFDKTGTLTEGVPAVVEVVPLYGSTRDDVIAIAAAAERRSEHPLARAVLAFAESQGIRPVPAAHTTAEPGLGVAADIDGGRAYVGSERLFREYGALDGGVLSVLDRLRAAGRTAMVVGRTNEGTAGIHVLGVIAVADRPRPEAARTLAALHHAGIRRIVMLTGDNERTARAMAAELGVDDVRADLLPDDKVAAIHALRGAGDRIIMVGDGVNDAPALAAADVGIAMGSAGTDVALETADIALMADDLSKLPDAIRFARKAERIIRANITFAILTKAAFVLLAVLGMATLWMAVLADMGASLIVIANGLRALRA